MRKDLQLPSRVLLDGGDQFELEELARRAFIDERAFSSNAEFWFNMALRFLENRRAHPIVKELLRSGPQE